MKNLLTIFTVSFIYISCSKDNITTPSNNNSTNNNPVIPSPPTASNTAVIIGDWGYDLYVIKASTGTIQWKGGNIAGSLECPAYFDGKIFSPSYGGIFVYDISTEDLIWNFPYLDRSDKGDTPIILNDIIYFGCRSSLFAYDAKTGIKKWEFLCPSDDPNNPYSSRGSIESSPTIANNIIYFTNSNGKIFALDVKDGTLKWKFSTDKSNAIYSGICFNNGIIYFGSDDKKLYAIDANSGVKKWEFKTGDKIRSSPTVKDNLLYFGSSDHILYVLDATTGLMQKEIVTGGEIESSPIVSNGLLYFGNKDGYLYAYDAKTFQMKWKFNIGVFGTIASPTIANGVVYIGGQQRRLYAIDAITGTKKWEFEADDYIFTSATVIDSDNKVHYSGVSGSVN
ncbi:PQQ-binding-like beta-propeller repeat protein [Emticicia sp. 17c]|uniref:PQQ-binding-like beta-propeller repeat protein n=1 Tax=Emticicia sp. 17c TaxID=3127704 RepID=UPI00301BFE5A